MHFHVMINVAHLNHPQEKTSQGITCLRMHHFAYQSNVENNVIYHT